jgi:hypothetical protein
MPGHPELMGDRPAARPKLPAAHDQLREASVYRRRGQTTRAKLEIIAACLKAIDECGCGEDQR